MFIDNLGNLVAAIDDGVIKPPVCYIESSVKDEELRLWFRLWNVYNIPNPSLKDYFNVVISRFNINHPVVISSGTENSEPVRSYTILKALGSSVVDFVYQYNFPIINDLLGYFSEPKVYVHPEYMKDPDARKDVDKLYKKAEIVITSKPVGNVLVYPIENEERPYPLKKRIYNFSEARVYDRKVLFRNGIIEYGSWLNSN